MLSSNQAPPSLESLDVALRTLPVPDQHFHGVHFYSDERAWCRIAADFIADGLRRHEAIVAIVTPAHHVRILERLLALDRSVPDLLDTQSLRLLDADDTLRLFMRETGPDAELFHRHVGGIVRAAAESRSPARVRACGEMVDLLCQQGRQADAIRLEMLWNELATTADLSLLCSYATHSFRKQIVPSGVVVQHTHLLNENGAAVDVPVATA